MPTPTATASQSCAAPAHRLLVAMDANAAAYRRAVQTSAPGDC